MIFTATEHNHEIVNQLVQRPKKVWISSFNFNCGISDRGTVYQRSETFQALEQVNDGTRDSRILIGQPQRVDELWIRRLTNTAEYFKNIQWRFRADLHLKTWLFFPLKGGPLALFGGRNLGDSSWADASLFLSTKNSRELSDYYESLWAGATKVQKSTFKLLT